MGFVLVIDPIDDQRAKTCNFLTSEGLSILPAQTEKEGLDLLMRHPIDIVLADLDMQGEGSQGFLDRAFELRPLVRVIMQGSDNNTTEGVNAILSGAFTVLVRPTEPAKLLATVKAAFQSLAQIKGMERQRQPTAQITTKSFPFIGSSLQIKSIQQKINAISQSKATVFITGESGTGKELAALAIHENSPRSTGPFIALNCGAIPQDLLESEVFGHLKGSFTGAIADKLGAAQAADGGTLFLDEVCEMSPALQTKLLRFLQTSTILPVGATKPRDVNVRFVCATNRDPMEAVRLGQFREDLFYRLYVIPLEIPPLRERGADILEIANSFLARYGTEEGKHFNGLTDEASETLLAYPWPGNVRQLLNVLQNIAVLHPGGEVTHDMLPPQITAQRADTNGIPAPLTDTTGLSPQSLVGQSYATIERRIIEATLASVDGSVPKAARILELSPSTLYRKIEGWKPAP